MAEEIILPEEKKCFLKELNKKGFILEERAFKVLKDDILPKPPECKKNFPVRDFEGNLRDIDVMCKFTNKYLIIDCKRTEYSWFFPKNMEEKDQINLIFNSNKEIKVLGRLTSDFITCYSDISLVLEDKKFVKKNDKKGLRVAYEDVHKKIKQVLRETEGFLELIRHQIGNNHLFFPVIVTNTDLYLIKYKYENINEKGDLKEYKLEKVPFLIYNITEVMHWGNPQQIILNTGYHITERSHLKSVFIVNINHLQKFIDKIRLQDLGI